MFTFVSQVLASALLNPSPAGHSSPYFASLLLSMTLQVRTCCALVHPVSTACIPPLASTMHHSLRPCVPSSDACLCPAQGSCVTCIDPLCPPPPVAAVHANPPPPVSRGSCHPLASDVHRRMPCRCCLC